MTESFHERLSALDTSFLELENECVHMHVGSVCILEPGPLALPDGGVDFERIETLLAEGIERVPRLRQRLREIPVTGHPIWVDDPHFRLSYHVRHSALPHPGDERQLKRLAGRVLSTKLDRHRPLWELHVVEGLEGGRFALVWKVHHCLSDGISGVDILSAFLSPSPEPKARDDRPRPPWRPRPEPSAAELAVAEVGRRTSLPGQLMSRLSSALEDPRAAIEDATHAATGLLESFAKTFSPASPTPLNAPIGPHRRFDWTRFDLEAVRTIARDNGAKLNDVVLASVAGAVRRFLVTHEAPITDLDFRVFIPVSTRHAAERGALGNRVSMVVASLPIDESDPRERLRRIVDETKHVKASGQAEGAEAFEELSDWTTPSLITLLSRIAAGRRIFNLIVTNVPGPDYTVHLDGAPMRACYPLVPLYEEQALGIALLSYDGGLFWGFNSCWDAMPDLHEFVEDVDSEFELLAGL